jgi:hypothetical protein
MPSCTASPPSSSRPTTAFASRLLFPIRHAILTPPPSRGPWPACIRAVPSAAFSSTASNVHHARPSCTPTRSRPEFPQRRHRYALHVVVLHAVALHVVALHSPFYCRTHAHLGLAASQVPPRPSSPSYCRARSRCPPCGSVPSRHASPPSAHARTVRVLGRVTSCLHRSRAAAAAPLARARQYREPRACSSAATPILFCSRAATSRASFQRRLARVPLTRLRHASRASHVHTRAYGRPLLASARSPAPAQAEPPHSALAHTLQPSAGAPLLGLPEPPLCAPARLAPVEPPPRAQQLPPAPAPVRCAPACACARPAARAASHLSPCRAAAARLEPPARARPAPAHPRASAAQLLRSSRAHTSRASARLWRGERGRGRTGVETRERERRRQRIKKHQGEEKQRRRGNGFPQGLMRNFRKLQGPVCKAKFPINPKP